MRLYSFGADAVNTVMNNEPIENSVNEGVESPVSAFLHSLGINNGVPVSGTFELTSRCNFNCKMCYVHSAECNRLKQAEMSADWWIKTGEAAVSQGMVFLLLTGGEPLIRDDFPEIFSALNKMGLIISVNTNGYFLNGKIAELFKENPPNRINVSLYGTDDDTYERFTGTRGFSKVISNIELMRSLGIDVRLNCSITPNNCNDIRNIYKLSKELGLYIKTTPYMYPRMRVDGVTGENSGRLSPEDAAYYRVLWSSLKYSPDDFILKARNMKKGIAAFENECVEEAPEGKVRCRAGRSSFWINKNGEMSMCGIIDKTFDVKTLGFDGAWDKIREYTSSIVLPQKCQSCKFRHICNVCAAVCYTETGSFSEIPEYVCRFSEETARLTEIELERLEKDYGN